MRLVARVMTSLLLLLGPAAPAAGVGVGVGAGAGPERQRASIAEALDVLHDWDVRRARAWAQTDPAALRSLYLPGSSAARADVRLLRSYDARGLVVRRIVTQVFGIRVLRREPGLLTIRVLDRVAGGRVDDGGREVRLPGTRPAVRRIELLRIAGTWKVAAVSR